MADDLIPPQIVNGGAGAPPSPGRVLGPDYRQVQNPAEVDVHGFDRAASIAGDAASARAAALGNVFKEFENIGSNVYNGLQRQAGQQAGAAAGMDPNFKPKTGLQAITTYGQSYNAAAHQTYITQSQLSLEKSLTDIESDSQGNPEGFQARATGVVQAALKNMDPLYVPEMTNWAQSRIQAGLNRQNQQKAEDVRNTALATYQTATPDLITSALHTAAALPGPQGDAVIAKLVSDDQDRLSALVASRTITPEQAVTLHQRMVDSTHQQMSGQKVDISLQPILATMRSNVEAADKLIVRDDPNLTPEENAARTAEFEKARDAYVQTQTRAHVDALATVHKQLDGGAYGPDVEPQLHALYRAGALSEEGLFSGLAQSLRNQRSEIEDAASMRLVDGALHGGPRLDPKDPDQQKAANLYFDRKVVVDGGDSISNPQYAIAAAEFFRQTNILPESVQSRIRVGLLSGDATQATQAAALAGKIQGVNPSADAFVSNPHLAALSSLINDNLKAGMAPTQAYQLANTQTQVTPEIQKTREARYSQAVKMTNDTNVQSLQKQLDKATPGLFAHSPAVPVEMQAQNDSLVRQFFTQTGDIGKARQLAVEQLQKTWTVTKVNGSPELTQFGIPDALVPTVRSDIASSAAAAGYTGDPSAIHLTPNANTSASQGRIWSLTHTAADGSTDVLLDRNNRPLQYALPSSQDFAKIRQQRINAELDAARKQRDVERQNSADQSAIEAELSKHYLTPQPTGWGSVANR